MPSLSDPRMLALALAGAVLLGALFGVLLTQLRCQRRLGALETARATLAGQLEAERANAEARIEALEDARERLGETFEVLAAHALRSNQEDFLRLARESLGQFQQQAQSDLTQRQKAIDNMLLPIRTALEKTEQQVREMEQARQTAQGALAQYLEGMAQTQQALQAETRNLVQALRRPEVRGRWGELTLRRLVELAGMVEHCDFTEQAHRATEDGALRPDMVIRLPDEREIVVDVKTPLDAYLSAVEAADDGIRREALARHARNVRQRVRELSSKQYWAQFRGSLDFVILFIPGDQFLTAALDDDHALLEDALRARVILATPTSLVALLRAVAFSWRQMAIIRHADAIRDLGEEFYKRLATFTEHLARLGRNLGGSVESYNRAVGSLERQVLSAARRLAEMGISTPKELAGLEPLEQAPREPAEPTPAPAPDPAP